MSAALTDIEIDGWMTSVHLFPNANPYGVPRYVFISLLEEVIRRRAEDSGVRDALEELVEVARLRGDNNVGDPRTDPKEYTARMQTAWDEAEQALDGTREPTVDVWARLVAWRRTRTHHSVNLMTEETGDFVAVLRWQAPDDETYSLSQRGVTPADAVAAALDAIERTEEHPE